MGQPTAYRWFNFATNRTDWRTGPPTDDAAARQYIPQDAETQDYYGRLRDQGHAPAEAIRTIVTGALNAWHPAPRIPNL